MLLADAIKLYNLGFSLIPLNGEKKPYIDWTEFQTRRASIAEITGWFKEYKKLNIGIVTGQLSNLYVVDFDNEFSLQELQKNGELPKTVTVKTTDGCHYYYRPNTKLLRNRRSFFPDVDFRGEGGFAVAPGSVHPSGKQYHWIHSPAEQEIAIIPEWLELMVATKTKKKRKKAKRKKQERINNPESTEQAKEKECITGNSLNGRFNKVLRKLQKKIPDLRIIRGIKTTSRIMDFNKCFPDREKRIQYILWDEQNETQIKSVQDFTIYYGIILDDSKNRLKQFGNQIISILTRNGMKIIGNGDTIGRITISHHLQPKASTPKPSELPQD